MDVWTDWRPGCLPLETSGFGSSHQGLFIIFIAASQYGNIRLPGQDSDAAMGIESQPKVLILVVSPMGPLSEMPLPLPPV